MKLRVHMVEPSNEDIAGPLRALLDADITLTSGIAPPSLADYHILIAGVPERELLTASSDLHTVIIPWAGLSTRTRELLLEFPHLVVYNMHHNAAPVAETAITLMMAAAKRLLPIDRRFRAHDWSPRYTSGGSMLLNGKTALIVGYGAIGREIGRRCRGLNMQIIAVKRNVTAPVDDYTEIHASAELPQLLHRSAVLFISAPLTPETRGLIGEKELALLPDGAIIINVARGPIVDEAALFQELQSGRLRAGLDVWYNYPKEEKDRTNTPPSAYPFHELDNVVMTPHMSEESDDTELLRVTELAKMLNAVVSGQPLPNEIDPRQGY